MYVNFGCFSYIIHGSRYDAILNATLLKYANSIEAIGFLFDCNRARIC